MHRINLSPPEQAALESTFKTTLDHRLRDRCQAVLIASRGRKRTEIAQDSGVHRSTVILWLKRYDKRGLTGLQINGLLARRGGFPKHWPRRSKRG